MKTKRTTENRPYVENYPPLHEWLKKHEANCCWQLPLGEPSDPAAYVEQWSMTVNGARTRVPSLSVADIILRRTSSFVIVVRSDRTGWDIFTSGNDGRVPETLADAERRIARRPEREDENTAKFVAVMSQIAQGAVNINSGLTEIRPTSAIHRALEQLCEMVTRGVVGVLK